MKAPLYTKEGKKKKEVVLNPEIYATRVNQRLLDLVRNAFAANLRRGTASTKERADVRGGGRKPWKQKGTGRARAGSSNSPLWRGGGITFGPKPRSYNVKLSQSMRTQALISALSLRGDQKRIMLLENTKLDNPKTRDWVKILNKLPLDGKRALCIVKDLESNLDRASRNVSKWVRVRKASDVNAHHVLQKEKLVIDHEALEIIEDRLLKTKAKGEVEGAKS